MGRREPGQEEGGGGEARGLRQSKGDSSVDQESFKTGREECPVPREVGKGDESRRESSSQKGTEPWVRAMPWGERRGSEEERRGGDRPPLKSWPEAIKVPP